MVVDDHPLFRKKALEKLQSPEQLNMLMTVTSPRGWVALLALSILVISAAVWAIFGSVQATVSGRGVLIAKADNRLEAVIFVSPEDSRRIQPGLVAHISPANARREEYGLIVGEVLSIEAVPSSNAQMLEIVGTDTFVQSLISTGELIQVRIQLQEDDTPTGYYWTVAEGPNTALRPGTLASGNVVVSQERPIELVFDNFKALFSVE